MNATIAQALVRHILTAIAGAFAVRYGVGSEVTDAIVSGLTALVGVGWSIYDKRAK